MKVNREFSPKVRHLIYERAGYLCEVCREDSIDHCHHKLMRSQGGLGTVDNGLGVCHACHHHIHLNPYWSYINGYLIRSGIESDDVA